MWFSSSTFDPLSVDQEVGLVHLSRWRQTVEDDLDVPGCKACLLENVAKTIGLVALRLDKIKPYRFYLLPRPAQCLAIGVGTGYAPEQREGVLDSASVDSWT